MYFDSNKNELIGYKPKRLSLPDGSTLMGNISDEQYAELGFYRYVAPVYDEATQKITETILVSNGTATHEVVDKTPEELSADATRKLKKDVNQLEMVDRATLRLFLTLADTLIDKGVIAATDFTVAERQLYQQVKSLKGQIW